MNLANFLQNLSAKNVELWTDSGKLRYRAPEDVLTPEVLTEIKQHKQEIIDLLTKSATSATTYPLSHRQRGIWLTYQLAPSSTAYNVACALRLIPNLDISALQQASQALIERHPVLRSTYTIQDGEPVQTVHEDQQVSFNAQEAFNWSQDDLNNWLERRQASACVAELGLSDKIVLIHGDATLVDLPEKADVCVSEIVGSIGGCEGAAVIINNSRRLLKQDGAMIPTRSVTKIAAVTLPDEILHNPKFAKGTEYYTQKIFEQIGYSFDLRVCIRRFPQSNILSNVDIFEDFDFTKNVIADELHEVNFTISQSRRLDGFLVWLNLHTIEGEEIDILEHEYCWLPVYFPVFQPGIDVSEGDVIQAFCSRKLCDNHLNPDYGIKGRLIRKNGEVIEFEYVFYHQKQLFQQTPFYQRLFANSSKDANDRSNNLTQDIRNYLKELLPEYMMPNAFVTLDILPLTPNGKVDRRALPAPSKQLAFSDSFVSPKTQTEQTLARIWAEVLQVEQVGIEDNFFELGGDSILSIQIVAKANAAGLQLTNKQLFQHPTITELARVAGTVSEQKTPQASQGLVIGEVLLTPIQHWFFERHLPEPHHWNQAILLEVRQTLDIDVLSQVVQQLLVHHDALRLRFTESAFVWHQVNTESDSALPCTLVDLSTFPEVEQTSVMETATAELQASLNLSTGPLLRVALFNLGSGKPQRLLLIVIWHQ